MCDTYLIKKDVYDKSIEEETDKAVKLAVPYSYTGENQNYDSVFVFWIPKSLLWSEDYSTGETVEYRIPKTFIDGKIKEMGSDSSFAFKHLKWHLNRFNKLGRVAPKSPNVIYK